MKDKAKIAKKEIFVVLACAVFLLPGIGAISSGGHHSDWPAWMRNFKDY